MERMALLEKSGRSNPELIEKDRCIHDLEKCLKDLQKETDQLKETSTKDFKSRERLERQRTLALKEAQFLREQLKSFTMEEVINMQGTYDAQKSERIQELESLLDAYKDEVEKLKVASAVGQNESPSPSRKRPADGLDDHGVGELSRRNRQLQDDLDKLERSNALFCNEISALKFQLSSMENTSIRVLQLKDNPTSREQSVKSSLLESLRQENTALLAQIDGRTDKLGRVVPRSSLDNARAEIKAMEKVVAEKEKRMTRLKEIWSAKSMELREAVYSLLGWRFDFMPNGRVKVTHMFAGNEDQSIEFDGEKAFRHHENFGWA
ncbi:spindle assembly checkpoint component Mad1 [Geopyxis carbonaria]|nr:spindle assembly checkpoint component Mad1 [Geopyxis carbonaria]